MQLSGETLAVGGWQTARSGSGGKSRGACCRFDTESKGRDATEGLSVCITCAAGADGAMTATQDQQQRPRQQASQPQQHAQAQAQHQHQQAAQQQQQQQQAETNARLKNEYLRKQMRWLLLLRHCAKCQMGSAATVAAAQSQSNCGNTF